MHPARRAVAGLDEARHEIETVNQLLREGLPARPVPGSTTERGAVRAAADRLGIDRRSLMNRIGTPDEPGSHFRRFALQVDWEAGEKAEAERGEHHKRFDPVLPGYAIKRTTTRFDRDGDVSAQYVTQTKAPGPKGEIPAGHVVKGVSQLRDAEGRIAFEWVKTREDDGDPALFATALRETMLEVRGRAVVADPVAATDEDLLTVYVIPDLHLGMLAWAWECGESYDLRIAAEMARRELARLLAMAPPSRHAVLLFLGDYFHMNDRKNVTPRSGHTLDADGRWRKVYDVGARLAVGLSEAVAERHERVEIAFLPGNHDEDAAKTLAVALDLYFERHSDRITVAGAPGDHWFRRFGKCLLGATHGHTMKPDRMAMMLATDRAKDWGETEHRHMFFGHIHHETAKEVGTVRVESFSSPAGKDAHASSGGYRSGRALNAVTFHAEDGEVCRHRVNIRASQIGAEQGIAA